MKIPPSEFDPLLSAVEPRNYTNFPRRFRNGFKMDTNRLVDEEIGDGDPDLDEDEIEDENSISTSRIILNPEILPFHEFAFKILKKFIGLVLALISGIFGAGLTVSVKILSNQGYHPFLLALIKYQFSTIFGPPIIGCIWCCSRRRTLFDHIWPLNTESIKNLLLILLRTTLGVLQTILQYYSLRYLNVADCSVIIMSNSITTVFLAKLFLNEPLGLIPILVGIISLSGIVVMAKPPFITGKETFDDNMLTGVTLALISMLMASLIIIVVRYMRKIHFCVFVTLYGYMATIEIVVLIIIQYGLGNIIEMPTNPDYWPIMCGCAILAFCGQSLNVLSLHYERASHISLIRTCDIIFTFGLQYIYLGIKPDTQSELGAGVLMFGVLLIGLRRWILSLPPHHAYRIRFGFLLK